MSFQTFLASDSPMDEVKNTHIKLLSVNEAMKQDISLSGMVLSSSAFDHNKQDVVLWVDSEENLGEIAIKNTEKAYLGRDDSPLVTDLLFFSTLEWRCTKERVEKLITYIQEHLKKATEIEVWNLWVGYDETVSRPRKRNVCVDELTLEDFEKMFWVGQQYNDWQQYECLSIKRLL